MAAEPLVILVADHHPDDLAARVEAAAPGSRLIVASKVESAHESLRDAHVIAGHLPAERFAAARSLRWQHSWLAGAGDVLHPALAASDVVLTSSAGNGGIPLAEHAMLLMLMLDRDVPRWMRAQRAHEWDPYRHRELAGSTLGIIGLGNAGADLALKARAFHMRVVGMRRRPELDVAGVDEIFAPDQLLAFLADCDYVVITAPSTPETRGLINRDALAAMKDTAALVVVSRGGIVDDDALLEALSTGRLRAAGLDAHGVEPLPADSPFWDLPNVIVTPHNGATTPGTLVRQGEIFFDNLARFVRGDDLMNVVVADRGY
ncbi:MAG TPA: D-2-hydroxyacid dehydrogenase [Pseudolysinimonas sp.]|nr:D-2-hydroxyacid dehydrogenase [Pseudolysinimonas sp.]